MGGKVVVSQLGARMHYAVPAIFASRGELSQFYTDICATKGWPRIVNALPSFLLPKAVRRLVGRRPDKVPVALMTVFPAFGTKSALRRMRVGNVIDETSHALWAGREFSVMVARRGFHGAAGLYAFSGDALEQMQAAKSEHMWTAVEQMIAPRDVVEQLIDHEMDCFPDWAGPPKRNPYAAAFANRERAEWALADKIICPSEFVRRHVIANGGDPARCDVVPYGVDSRTGGYRQARMPGPLRVLTVGEVGLRKGSPYVLKAARLMGDHAQFRMVGRVTPPHTVAREMAKHIDLRGIVPRSEVAVDFAWADVFLLPSICEGSATVVYEALAAGLPVITTENTGSVVQDGYDGFIVPIGDARAIVSRLEMLLDDPDLWKTMSHAALQRAGDFTVEQYGRRLRASLSSLPARRPA